MDHVISSDGTSIAYEASGSGPVVILVGGAFSHRTFPKTVQLAQLLSGDLTAVNYDRRGRGDSSDHAPYAIEREIDDLAALIDRLGGSASLWGWSSGAVLALRAAATGLPIRDLALYEPPFLVDDSRPLPAPDFSERLTALVTDGDRGGAVKLYMTEGMGAPAIFVNAMRILPVWSRLKEQAHTLPYDWALLDGTLTGRPLQAEPWSAVTARTLVMAGAKSPQQLRSAASGLAAVVPDAERRLLEGENHNPSMKVQAPVIAEFLARGARATAGLAA